MPQRRHAHGGSPSAYGTPHETRFRQFVSDHRSFRQTVMLAADRKLLRQLDDTPNVNCPTHRDSSSRSLNVVLVDAGRGTQERARERFFNSGRVMESEYW